jgi:hypothetical protein
MAGKYRNRRSFSGRHFDALEPRLLCSIPTLTSIKVFKTAVANIEFPITYADLLANSNAEDADSDPISFKIATIPANSVIKINGNPAAVGDEIAAGDTVTWKGPIQRGGTLTAFTVKAFDGVDESKSRVGVRVLTNLKPGVIINVSKGNANEKNGATTGNGVFNFIRQGQGYGSALVVNYTITGTASNNGSDITQILSGTVTIPAGKSSVKLSFNPIDDGVPEGNEKITLTLVQDVTLSYLVNPFQPKATITIVDNNKLPTFNTATPLTGALMNTPFTITYNDLITATGADDFENDPISFKIVSVPAGTLKKNGVAVVPGTTIFAAGDTLEWTPIPNFIGTFNAFNIAATDSGVVFTGAKTVKILVTQ